MKKKMLILTGLFFNNAGNQSMINSIKGYENEYKITLFTVANLESNAFISIEEVGSTLKDTKIIYWPSKFLSKIKKFNSLFKKINHRKKNVENIKTELESDKLLNTKITAAILFNYKIRSYILAIQGIILFLKDRPDVVCAYEIHSMFAAKLIKKIFPKSFIFGKFQGTVLCENLDSDNFHELSNTHHKLDADGMKYAKYLDASIMTNDGTRGDEVLEKFGCQKQNILLIPNGVDDRFINSRKKSALFKNKSGLIKTISISRLMGWKRVDKIISAYSLMKNNNSYEHEIIGPGDENQINLITNLIKANNLENTIKYHGGKSIDFVIKSLNESDLLISVYKHGLITNPVFEALAMGIPVLTIKNQDLINVLGERSSGCFFIEEPGSENLAKTLSEFLEKLTKEEIYKKKEILLDMSHPTWHHRSKLELNFISDLKSNISTY